MSIKADVAELETIRMELKLVAEKRKKLKQRELAIQTRIAEYLKSKDQPGVKHQGTAIILEEKEKHSHKKAKERDADAIQVLEKHGIQDAEKVLKEIMEARKGEPILKESLKIQKYKGT